MDLAISLPTKANSWEVVKRAEELGYTHAWFYDTQLLNAEVFVRDGRRGDENLKIKLCAGVADSVQSDWPRSPPAVSPRSMRWRLAALSLVPRPALRDDERLALALSRSRGLKNT